MVFIVRIPRENRSASSSSPSTANSRSGSRSPSRLAAATADTAQTSMAPSTTSQMQSGNGEQTAGAERNEITIGSEGQSGSLPLASSSSSSSHTPAPAAVAFAHKQEATTLETSSSSWSSMQTSGLSSQDTPPQPSLLAGDVDNTQSQSQSVQDALAALQMLSLGGAKGSMVQADQQAPMKTEKPPIGDTRASLPEQALLSGASNLDIILAPAVLAHRYVRGRDVSMIVERPERIRAILVGVAAVLGRVGANEESRLAQAARQQGADKATDADDLVAQLQGMSVASTSASTSTATRPSPIQVLHSTRSVNLDPPHPAVAAVHAMEDEPADWVETEHEEKRKRKKASKVEPQGITSGGTVKVEVDANGSPIQLQGESTSTSTSTPSASTSYAAYLSHLCSSAPHAPPAPPPPKLPPPRGLRKVASTNFTPLIKEGRTRRAAAAAASATPAKDEPAQVSQAPQQKIEAESSDNAAAAVGIPQVTVQQSAPVTPQNSSVIRIDPSKTTANEVVRANEVGAGSSRSSEEEEGDLHASEVPYHFSQGDLYLRGTGKTDVSSLGAGSGTGNGISMEELGSYGSGEAIQHAIGASIEAVDRVVSAARIANGGQQGPTSTALSPMVFSASKPDASADSTTRPSRRAFVLTRPPGHHCSSTLPSGFCWVNNAAIAAVHAYQAHGVDRAVIFDIDLHHGNGTQKIAWKINEETKRNDADRDARLAALRSHVSGRGRGGTASRGRGAAARKSAGGGTALAEEEAKIPPRGLKVFYSSLHDIESYPCEDGDATLVRDASVCIEGAHGQWIQNIHLDSYDSPTSFASLYKRKYSTLFSKARHFLSSTSADPARTLILISCGFDACSYELPGMQRHGKHVPPGFYGRFAHDAVRLAEEVAQGKVISLLEGGYGDRALISASVAHLMGLSGEMNLKDEDKAGDEDENAPATSAMSATTSPFKPHATGHTITAPPDPYAHTWFAPEALKSLEKLLTSSATATSAGSGGGGNLFKQSSASTSAAAAGAWLQSTMDHFTVFEELCEPFVRAFKGKPKAGRR